MLFQLFVSIIKIQRGMNDRSTLRKFGLISSSVELECVSTLRGENRLLG